MNDLSHLMEGIEHEIRGVGAPQEITGIAYDSRQVEPGNLFFCLRGARHDGHRFAKAALGAGATAVVANHDLALEPDTPAIRVRDARRAMAIVAGRYYDHPSRRMQVIGVTGTNGKTTTTYFTASVFEKAGYTSGVMGTLGYHLGDRWHPAEMTTPESPDLQRYLRHMADRGVRAVAMEVSSHALELDRVLGTEFQTVVFTNLGHDHLDFHGTLERYREAKESLFLNGRRGPGSFGRGRIAVVNRDDVTGRGILKKTPLPTVTYGIDSEADVRAEALHLGPESTRMTLRFPDGSLPVELRMPGRVNIYNALAAAATAAASLISPEKIVEGLEALTHVPGRLESIRCGQPFGVWVDYAHNPPALGRLLSGVREMTAGRLIAVFGCGGDRDRAKRPEMAKLASQLADLTVVTSDNPRAEDPMAIIRDIERGFEPGAAYVVVPDRAEAIRRGIDEARAGDAVVIAGKGHEDYQILGETKIHFDDREVARELLEKKWT